MSKVFDRVKVVTATTGTGTLTLGNPENGLRSFAAAGAVNGDVVYYVIEEGFAWEIGYGTYSTSGPTLTRTVIASSNANAALNLGGTAKVFSSPVKAYFDGLVPIRITGGLGGKTTNGLRLPVAKAPKDFVINAANCYGQAYTAATAGVTVTLKKRSTAGVDTTLGTFVWSASGVLAAVTITVSAVSAGDMLFLDFPATADTTLADLVILVSS